MDHSLEEMARNLENEKKENMQKSIRIEKMLTREVTKSFDYYTPSNPSNPSNFASQEGNLNIEVNWSKI